MIVRRVSLLACLTFLLSISLLSQEVVHDSLPISFKKSELLYSTVIMAENKPDLVISHRLPLYDIYDFYLDEKYCIIIYNMKNAYVLTAAYFDSANQEWVIDYFMKTFAKSKSNGVVNAELHSMKILNGSDVETVVTKNGPKRILQKLYGTTDFPKIHTLRLTKSKITYLNLTGTAGYCSDIRPSSPRVEIEN